MKKVLGIINHPPVGNSFSHEAIEMLMVYAAFGFQVSILLRGSGVLHLQHSQQPEVHKFKNHSALFAALDLYEIDHLIVDKAAMDEYQCQADEKITYKCIDINDIGASFDDYSEVLNF